MCADRTPSLEGIAQELEGQLKEAEWQIAEYEGRLKHANDALRAVVTNLDGENEDGNIFPEAALARARSALGVEA